MKWLDKQVEWFKSFFSEPDGKASNKRLIGFSVVGAFLFSWVKTSLSTMVIQDIPINWAFLITAILGLSVWGNIQKDKVATSELLSNLKLTDEGKSKLEGLKTLPDKTVADKEEIKELTKKDI